jgi:hypothetical protein
MKIDGEQVASPTGQDAQAPMTTEQLVASATTSHGMPASRRPARGHGYQLRGLNYIPLSRLHEGRFGRMFRLQPYLPSDERIAEVAKVDGCDRPPGLSTGQQRHSRRVHLRRPAHRPRSTFDTASSLERQNDPNALTNFRSTRFDLDCVYGGRGPVDDPYLYDKNEGGEKLLIGNVAADGSADDDLPRNTQGTALIDDPRNDENTFVSQLQLTMLKFHSAVVDIVRADPSLVLNSEDVFTAAQRIVRCTTSGWSSTTSCDARSVTTC